MNSIERGLKLLNIQYHLEYTQDKCYRIRINLKSEVLKFFKEVGSSNKKHIDRFLIWRIKEENSQYNPPFKWTYKNKQFSKFIKKDINFIEISEIRKEYKFNIILKELLNKYKSSEIAKKLGVNSRSVRRWREKKRVPSAEYIPFLIKITKKNGVNLQNYKN